MNTQLFYEEERRLSYNPAAQLHHSRKGIKKLFAFDDRFVAVAKQLAYLINQSKFSKIKLLDIAIGDGVYERMLPKELLDCIEIYGLDISKTQLSRVKDIIIEGKVVDLDSEKLPYKDNTFDIVIISELLEHVFYPDRVLYEAVRTLKKGGYFLLTYPNSGALQLRLSILFTGASPLFNYPGNKEHIRFFQKKDILEMINGRAQLIKYTGIGSLLFAKWNFPVLIPMFRLKQIIWNVFLPNLALGNIMIFKK